ncbi:MAG: LPS assembly protein LptD [Pseudomonadota bacterium]
MTERMASSVATLPLTKHGPWRLNAPTLRWRRAGSMTAAAALFAFVSPAPGAAQTFGDQPASNIPTLTEQVRQRVGDRSDVSEPPTLEADEIDYDANTQVVRARGDVRVFHGDRVLRADMITYDAVNDEITASGDVTLVNPDGSVVAADDAAFDSELANGLVQGARAVLSDGRARLAAVEARRIDGRFTSLSKAVFSPCEVCEDNPTPLWRIRARRIVQDEQTRDITYEDATFEVLGVPIGYLPFFSHADPSVSRRTGFLTPSYLSTDTIGEAVKIPYFIAFGPSRDLTITPFLATEVNPVLELEYRAWEGYGKYQIGGSATFSDDSVEEGFRGHIYGDGSFDLGSDFVAGFDALVASDDTYLRRYDYTQTDRTTSRAYVQRFGDRGFGSLETVYYQSFREDEPAGDIPLVLPNFDFEQNYDSPVLGGDVAFRANALALSRNEGRDVTRISGEAEWSRLTTTSFGLLLDTSASVRGDAYYVADDAEFDEQFVGRVLPLASLELSYPFGKATERADHVISPIASAVYAPYGGNPDEIPNEDSIDAELDELSIFSNNRFPGLDRWEEGPRATAGLRYQRIARDAGPDIEATIGQTYRLRDGQFSSGSGLSDEVSDIVGSWQVAFDKLGSFGDDITVGHRFRVNDELSFHRNEVYASAELFDRARFSGGYVFLDADPEAGSEDDRAEVNARAELDVTNYWTVLGGARRDLEENRFVTALGGLRYADECIEVDFAVSRRFNSVEDAPASTNFGLSVRLLSVSN